MSVEGPVKFVRCLGPDYIQLPGLSMKDILSDLEEAKFVLG